VRDSWPRLSSSRRPLLDIARHTVRRFLRSEGYPERQPRRPHTAQIAPFESYLRARWAEGCRNAAQLSALAVYTIDPATAKRSLTLSLDTVTLLLTS
jgi:hypothetical protein